MANRIIDNDLQIFVERNQILEQLRERIVRFAASRLAEGVRDGAAQDIAQEVLLVLHEKYPTLDRAEDLVPLSLEIARFKVLAARRKTIRRGENTQVSVDDLPLAGGGPDPFEQAVRRERLNRLEAALKELGVRCREIFRMKLQGLSFIEIQKELKVGSLTTLYTWDLRCRKQLHERLGPDWESLKK
ncbi:MAG: putative polymerase sigma factor [Bryobacterales bacterium]|nr:putative polymerase sigma factor [Bryobacterales bacterium]